MRSFLLIVFVTFLCGATTYVEACSCYVDVGKSEKTLVNEAKRKSGAVFIGKLVKLVEPKNTGGTFTGEVIAEFEVERSWTSLKSSRITVYTTNICCICGFPFHEGVRYIVYGSYGKDKLYTTICTRTKPLADKESSDEKYLGPPLTIFPTKRISLEPNL